jgi:hypothetical protein
VALAAGVLTGAPLGSIGNPEVLLVEDDDEEDEDELLEEDRPDEDDELLEEDELLDDELDRPDELELLDDEDELELLDVLELAPPPPHAVNTRVQHAIPIRYLFIANLEGD